ncbi:hypothetical protein GCM10018787_41970 [Streptomyces thermodiastaticus]|nr:hypothetical protein GCM10018787_41970 [Streptomyces thermodiastaticus]
MTLSDRQREYLPAFREILPHVSEDRPGASVSVGRLWRAMNYWAVKNGTRTLPLGVAYALIREAGYKIQSTKRGKIVHGLALTAYSPPYVP